jgi:hypothetical protein
MDFLFTMQTKLNKLALTFYSSEGNQNPTGVRLPQVMLIAVQILRLFPRIPASKAEAMFISSTRGQQTVALIRF